MIRRSKIIIFIFLLLVIFVSIWGFGLFDFFKSKPRKMEIVGKVSAPSFSLLNLQGEKIDSRSFRGKVVLLDFWATWCPPCREEIPYLNELNSQYGKDGLVVVGIALDHGRSEEVKKFVEKNEVGYINLMGNDAVMEAFSNIPGMGPIQGIPTVFIIDRQGQICGKFVGLTEKKVFEEAIKPLL